MFDTLRLFLQKQNSTTVLSYIGLFCLSIYLLITSFSISNKFLITNDNVKKSDVEEVKMYPLLVSTSIAFILTLIYLIVNKFSLSKTKKFLIGLLMAAFVGLSVFIEFFMNFVEYRDYKIYALVNTLSFIIMLGFFIYITYGIPGSKNNFIRENYSNAVGFTFFFFFLMSVSIFIYYRMSLDENLQDDSILKGVVTANLMINSAFFLYIIIFLSNKITNYSSTNSCNMYSAI